jgi:dTDP-glucose pyrophosphorylase
MNTNKVQEQLIHQKEPVKSALNQLNELPDTLTLFVVNDSKQLVGTLTDGDVRRGLLGGLSLGDSTDKFMFRNFRFIRKKGFSLTDIEHFRERRIKLIPQLDDQNRIIRIIDLNKQHSVLPLDVVIMAGGRGDRMRPLTDSLPKPLLKIGDKPILEHNIDRLIEFGLDDFHIAVKYLGEQIEDYFGDGSDKSINIDYIRESTPLGTIGAVGLVEGFSSEHVLIMNSDVLTNIDYEDFYKNFVEEDASMAVASIPYKVNMPFAVLETEGSRILSFREKPVYTHYTSAGIYLVKRELLSMIPGGQHFHATELMDAVIAEGKKLIHFPILGYWIDIGRMEDFERAKQEFKHIKF